MIENSTDIAIALALLESVESCVETGCTASINLKSVSPSQCQATLAHLCAEGLVCRHFAPDADAAGAPREIIALTALGARALHTLRSRASAARWRAVS